MLQEGVFDDATSLKQSSVELKGGQIVLVIIFVSPKS